MKFLRNMFVLVTAVAAPGLGGVAAAPSTDPLLQTGIAEAAYAGGQVFLRGALTSPQNGALVSVNPTTGARTVHFDKGVIDVDMAGGRLWVLREATESARNFSILEWKDGAFQMVTTTGAGVPHPIAMFGGSQKIVLLTPVSVHIYDVGLRRWQGIKLKGALRYGVTMSAALTKSGDTIYFGANAIPAAPESRGQPNARANTGESVGVLQRIDLSNGSVAAIQKMRSSNPCDGPLSSDCSTVTAIVPDAVNGSCVIVAVGYVRGEVSDGRVLRVCRDEVTVMLEQKSANQPAGEPAAMTEPVWGLAATADGFWAVGRTTLYRFTGDAHTDAPLPAFAPVAGTPIGRAAGAVVVPTSVANAATVSGFTTLVATEP